MHDSAVKTVIASRKKELECNLVLVKFRGSYVGYTCLKIGNFVIVATLNRLGRD